MIQTRFPDIEIYIKRAETPMILAWLETVFGAAEILREAPSTQVKLPVTPATAAALKEMAANHDGLEPETEQAQEAGISTTHMNCTITEKAAKGGYTSVWFETNLTPWETDKACALDAFEHFKLETRCSTGGWEGEDDGGWLRFTRDGEQIVNWHQS